MLFNFLHFTVLFQLGFGMGVKEKDRRIPEIIEEDPDMHTVFIHSDSKEAQERYFDWKEENGELDNWKIPRIVTTLEKENQHEGVKRMLETVDGRLKPHFQGRFTNQEALVHVLDNPADPNDKLETASQDNKIDIHDSQDKESEVDTPDDVMERETDSSKSPGNENLNQNNNIGKERFLISQLESEDTFPTSIHADSNETLQKFFDYAETSGALANLKSPVIISSGSEILENNNNDPPFQHSTKFTHLQRLWMLNGKESDGKSRYKTYWNYVKQADRFGTTKEIFVFTNTQFENEQLEGLDLIPYRDSTATFIEQQGKFYALVKDPAAGLIKRVPLSRNRKESFEQQWKKIQMKNLKQFDVEMIRYMRSDHHQQDVMKGYWKETCENLNWALNMKLTSNQNIALVCLLHDIRKRRFKYEVPPQIEEQDCTSNPLKCKQEGNDGYAYRLHLEDGTGYSDKEFKNESDIYIYFPGAGSFEPVEVAYFEVEPEQETLRFSALGEFLQPTAFLALVLFGLFFTVFVKCTSQAEKAQIFLFIVGGIFEQGYPFLCYVRRQTNGVLWRGFLGMRIICFLWLLAWFFFRQYLSGSLIASLSSKTIPEASYNHSKLADFLGKKGANLVQPMKHNEEDWVRNSYLELEQKFPYLLKEKPITFVQPPTNQFPEMDLLECVLSKHLTEERKEFCKPFQGVMGKSFAYTTTKQRLRTIKKMAQLINPDVYVYERNVETPFMKPNFISTYDKRISTLLWNDILYMTESGIWEKWQKLDSELEALTDCVKFVRRIRNVDDSEARRICQQLLRAARPSAAERAFGKFEPISMRVISLPMMFFILSLFGCCVIFAFECGFFAWLKVYLAVKIWIWCLTVLRFTVRCKILYRSLKERDLKDLIRMFHWTNICKFLFNIIKSASSRLWNKMLDIAEWIRQVLEQLRKFLSWEREETQVIELEEVSTNIGIGGAGCIRSGDPVRMASSEPECTESNLSLHEEERIAFLLEMIEKYDRLEFPEEDMELLRKAKVIITPEEAEALMCGFRSEEDEVQEFSPGPSRPEMCSREAWVEKPGTEDHEIKNGKGRPLEEQRQPAGSETDLGETANYPGSESSDWELEDI